MSLYLADGKKVIGSRDTMFGGDLKTKRKRMKKKKRKKDKEKTEQKIQKYRNIFTSVSALKIIRILYNWRSRYQNLF